MNFKYLLDNLKVLDQLDGQHIDAFLSRLTSDDATRTYIDTKVLPRIEEQQKRQREVISREAKRLLEEMKNEKQEKNRH